MQTLPEVVAGREVGLGPGVRNAEVLLAALGAAGALLRAQTRFAHAVEKGHAAVLGQAAGIGREGWLRGVSWQTAHHGGQRRGLGQRRGRRR